MKITIFNGSHQLKPGNTSFMVEAFLQGAAEEGAEVRHIRLVEKNIEFCRACKVCWFRTPGHCPIKDDMEQLLKEYLASDMVGFATPLYTDNVSGRMKVFFDRLITIGDPHWETDAFGESVHRRRYDHPKGLVVLANCGYPEQTHFQPLSMLFKRMARNLHLELVGQIYRGGGGLLTHHDNQMKPFIAEYQKLLQKAGREVVRQGRISEKTDWLLERPLLPLPNFPETFRNKVNEIVDQQLSFLKGEKVVKD